MKGLNRVTLLGHLGKDPEIRYVDENVPVASFSLATSETYVAKSGERITQTEWHNVVAWRGLAEIVEKYVHKGDPLYVEGRIRTRSYQDRENPQLTRYITEIVVSDLRLLPRATGDQSAREAKVEASPVQPAASVPTAVDPFAESDDLPF
jgi:single-strand DNA-binding protein